MNIRTEEQLPGRWVAVDDETYDGPPAPIGSGFSEQEAIDDLLEQLPDEAFDFAHPVFPKEYAV